MPGRISIIARIFQGISGKILYLDRDACYKMEWRPQDNGLTFDEVDRDPIGLAQEKYPVLILGKCCYWETTKSYPITSHRDLVQAVAMEEKEICPFDQVISFIRPCKRGASESVVNIWLVKKEILEYLAAIKPYVVLPETALFPYMISGVEGMEAGERLLTVAKQKSTIFSFVDRAGLCYSLEKKGEASHFGMSTFKRVIGHAANKTVESHITSVRQYLEALCDGLGRLTPKELLAFRYHNPFRTGAVQKKIIVQGVAAASALLLTYIIASIGFLSYYDRNLTEEYTNRKASIGEYSRMEEQLQRDRQLCEALVQKVTGYASRVALLNLLAEKLPEGTVLMFLRVVDHEVEIRGEAITATKVLDALSGVPQIEAPRFIAGVGKSNKGDSETFLIGFRLK